MIREIVTHGFGFTEGVQYIPTFGFVAGAAVLVTHGPGLWCAVEMTMPAWQAVEVE